MPSESVNLQSQTNSTRGVTSDNQELPDATGFAGAAAEVNRPESGTVPGIVKGSYRPAEDAHPETVRVLVDAEGVEGLIDTDSSRVEVL